MKIVYECEICKAQHGTRESAEECEAKGSKQKYQEGEKVLYGAGDSASIVMITEASIVPTIHCFIYRVSMDREDNPGKIIYSYGWLSEKDLHALARITQ